MATLKIISNKDCKLYIDQEFVCDISANKLVKHAIDTGIYLIDVIANDESLLNNSESFDLEIVESEQQILKRITFASAKEPVVSKEKENEEEDFSNNPNLIFYNGFARVSKNNKYGFIDRSYKWVIDPQFDEAETLRNGYSLVCKSFDGKMKLTLLDSQCKLTLGMWFDEILYKSIETFVVRRQDELFRVDIQKMIYTDVWHLEGQVFNNKPIPVSITDGVSKRYGYINNEGSTVLPFIYDYVSDFSDSGWAEVERFGIRRYINKEGDVCVLNTLEEIESRSKEFYVIKLNKGSNLDYSYEWCGHLEIPNNKDFFLKGVYRLPVRRNGKWGYARLNDNNKNIQIEQIFECEYDEVISSSKYGYVIMRDGRNLCVVNLIGAKYAGGEKKGHYFYGARGEILFSQTCQEMYPITTFSFKWVSHYANGWEEYLYNFNNIVIKQNGKYGLFNRSGKCLMECIYDDICIKCKDEIASKDFCFYDSEKCNLIIEKNGLKGLCSTEGKIVLPPKYRDIYRYGGDYWAVLTDNNYYRLFDAEGKKMFDYSFDDIQYSIVKKDGKYGILDNNKNLITDCIFDEIREVSCKKNLLKSHYFETCSYVIRQDSKEGLLALNGNAIIPCNYDSILPVMGLEDKYVSFYIVTNKGKKAIWSINGNALTSFLFEEIKASEIGYYEHEVVLWLTKEQKVALAVLKEYEWFSYKTEFLFDEYVDSEYINGDSLYVVRKTNKLGIINLEGNVLIDFKYEDIECIDKKKAILKVKINGKWGIITLFKLTCTE